MVDIQSIRAEMARVNVTQVEMAKRLNISDRSFSLKINGVRKFSADEIYLIANHLGKEVNIFFKQ